MKNLLKTLTLTAFLSLSISLIAQQTVTGNVSDNNGLPLPGATVVIKGTSTGTTTDFDGNFSIETNSGEVLIVSYIGYITQELTVSDSATINVTVLSRATKLPWYRGKLLIESLIASASACVFGGFGLKKPSTIIPSSFP